MRTKYITPLPPYVIKTGGCFSLATVYKSSLNCVHVKMTGIYTTTTTTTNQPAAAAAAAAEKNGRKSHSITSATGLGPAPPPPVRPYKQKYIQPSALYYTIV
jgi:hypothetical protein